MHRNRQPLKHMIASAADFSAHRFTRVCVSFWFMHWSKAHDDLINPALLGSACGTQNQKGSGVRTVDYGPFIESQIDVCVRTDLQGLLWYKFGHVKPGSGASKTYVVHRVVGFRGLFYTPTPTLS